MAEMGIAELAERDIMTLSTGEARRALIARSLVHDPAVLVLDEPSAGLDPTAAWHLRQAMRELAEGGRTLVLVTHHIEDVVRQVDRVVLMRDAGIVADGPKTELLTAERLSDLFGCRARGRGARRRVPALVTHTPGRRPSAARSGGVSTELRSVRRRD